MSWTLDQDFTGRELTTDRVFSVRMLTHPLQWRHNDHCGVSNHQPHGCLLNRLFRQISKKTSKLRVTGLCVGNSPGPVNSPHKGPVTWKMFPFDDVIMHIYINTCLKNACDLYLSIHYFSFFESLFYTTPSVSWYGGMLCVVVCMLLAMDYYSQISLEIWLGQDEN